MYVSIDLGGTKTRVASSKNLKSIHKIERFATERDLQKEKELIVKAVGKVVGKDEVEYICIGVPGLVDRKRRHFKNVVNYPQLSDLPFGALLGVDFHTENIIAENDASLAGLAESRRGEAARHNVVVYLTLSTGVGGIRIEDKKISEFQTNSEPGHMIIVENGRYDDVCGQRGCLHSYLSGVAFKDIYRVDPEKAIAKEIWNEYGSHLATGIVNIIAMWNPEIIVLGGGISQKFDLFGPAMYEDLNLQNLFTVPKIVVSKLGDENGVLGGFDLIKQSLQ